MTSVFLREDFAPVSVTKDLAGRLAKFSRLEGFLSTDSYACFLLNAIIEAVESKPNFVSPRWAGEEESKTYQLAQDELARIREDLRPLVQITC